MLPLLPAATAASLTPEQTEHLRLCGGRFSKGRMTLPALVTELVKCAPAEVLMEPIMTAFAAAQVSRWH